MKMVFRNIDILLRKNIATMKPYASARDEFAGSAEIFLDANENPYPSSVNRYPDPLQWKVKEKIATIKGIEPEKMFLGNGSDEAIDLLIRAFCEPHEDAIIVLQPTYGMYAVCAAVNAVDVVNIRLNPDFDIDLNALSLSDPAAKILFLCSPNNPSGNILSSEKITDILTHFGGLVVIDEAYIDFARHKSFVAEIDRYPNLVVLQTFSKAWGLAGLRLGMCFASKEIIRILNKIKYPYNISATTQALVLEALDHAEQKDTWVSKIIEQRTKLAGALAALPITEKVYPSDANFLLVKVKEAHRTYRGLMDMGIIVRDRSNVVQCDNCLRITVGTPEENQQLLTALQNFK
jgi:histidinol-phosphate aminotransferase